MAHINSALRQAGYETRWLDLLMEGESLEEVLRTYRPDFIGVSLRNIDDVVIRKQEIYFGPLISISQTVRRVHPCPIILGGSGFSIFPERLLQFGEADFGIQGEGESSLLALLAALRNGGHYQDIPGLVYWRDTQVVANAPRRAAIECQLSPEDRPAAVRAHYLGASGMLNLQTQRGCAHLCCYCTYPVIEGRAHRRRPPEVVAEEMAQLQAQGVRYVFIVDSIFNSSARHVSDICEAILRRNVQMRWGCFLRPQGLTPDLMKLMARAGLVHIEYGSDSFCDSVLEAYGKRLTFADILHASELAWACKVDYCHFLICGGPGETMETLDEAFQNSLRLPNPVIMAVVGMRLYPGTPLHQRAICEGRVTAETDLLKPCYYLAPDLTADQIFDKMRTFTTRSPSWIPGDPQAGYTQLVERLRKRGVTGPLWSYFAALQRIMPQPVPIHHA
ncbi:MAG: lipid biosynthesis B12-binding/radical SAM protein [Verrucomicrobiota bacterium]